VGPLSSFLAIGVVALLGAGPTSALAAEGSRPPTPRQLAVSSKPWTGDFDRMLERRMIRVLVPYSRTLFYIDKGRERGVTAEIVREWERWLNQKYARQLGKRPLTVYLIPTTRDRLLPGVVEGLGDMAAGNITVTEQRLEIVDFVAPSDLRRVDEIVVAGPKAPAVESVDDLSGKTVHVRPATSHYQSLATLNERFVREGRAPITLTLLPDALEVEDTLEMVNAGLLDLVIADDWVVRIWAQVLPNLKPVRAATLRNDGQIGWAVRKDSPKLQAALQDFYATVVRKQGLFGYLQAQATRRVKQFRNNTADDELRRFEELMGLFRTYGARYNFDPLMLAAQGYQESQLDQTAKSHVGAVGVMQVMPATGAQLKVGDIRVTEPNIHAGAKYLDQLMTKTFPDAKFSEGNRPLFAFASYNAGPANISRMRRLAAQRGLDPDRWFNHVELVTAERIGVETTTYVRNIYKYYVAYKLTLEHMELQQKTKAQMRGGG
jgi:membrane-bound lytic murein transglycosylase MltF